MPRRRTWWPRRAARKAAGATRFCMGAAWRGPKRARSRARRSTMVREVQALGLETCATLGMLKDGQAEALQGRRPRLLQPQPRHRARVLRRDHHARARTRTGSTRSTRVRDAGLKVCCGGIVGMGEIARASRRPARAARQPDPYPESVPINHLVQVEGTPLHGDGSGARSASSSCARSRWRASLMPKAQVRLSAGRQRDGRRACRRCAFSPAPTRSSTARSC